MMSDENTKKEFMDMYGMKEYGIDKIIDQSFDLLGFDMFFTMGKTEVRAWPAEKGSTARYFIHSMSFSIKQIIYFLGNAQVRFIQILKLVSSRQNIGLSMNILKQMVIQT